MSHVALGFQLRHTDAHSAARRGVLQTTHGPVETPAFMPVGTQGTVKGLGVDQVRSTGAQMVLANTYHLMLRPGEAVVAELGGLHAFTGWSGPLLTDSGGFQLFSLAGQVRVEEEHALFRSHIDGSLWALSPERALAIQQALGTDVAMVLDHVVALPNEPAVVRDALDRTVRWAQRARDVSPRPGQMLFGIVQGGLHADWRIECATRLVDIGFDGYAVGGLSVGEEPAEMLRILEATVPALPVAKTRYLMGVGRPLDLIEAIARGIDLFDCVMPTRNGRNALAFTDLGPLRLRNRRFERDPRPLEEGCTCLACRQHSRAYLRHLFQASEMLGPVLVSLHNLTYYQRLLAAARSAIEEDRFQAFRAARLAAWPATGPPAS